MFEAVSRLQLGILRYSVKTQLPDFVRDREGLDPLEDAPYIGIIHLLMASQKVAFPVLFVNAGHQRGGWGSLLRLLRKPV